MHPYQMYKELGSRFVSEFGFESPPDIRTIKYMITDPEQRQSQSLTFDAHDKGPGYMRRFTMYMGENFRFRMDPLEDYVYCAQLLQSEAIAFAYNAWRRGFKGKRHELCSGVLVWQLNDNWPGTSWALVDYFLRPKPAYYTVKRALRPYTVGMERIITKKQPVTVRSYIDERRTIEVWATSSSLKTEEEASIIFKGYNIQTGRVMTLPVDSITFKLLPNQTTEITSFKIPQDMSTVIAAYLISSKGEEVARYISWPEPLKYAKFSKDPKIEIEVFDDNVRVSASTPVKALILAVDGADGENAVWDDNCIDLVPEEEITIRVKGLNGRKINTRWLYDWESDVAPKHSNYLRE